MKYIFLLIFSISIPFYSCTTSKNMDYNQRSSGHYKLYSFPNKIKTSFDQDRYKRLVIISSNNFEGNIREKEYRIKNNLDEKRVLKSGGLSAMKTYSDIFRKEYNDNVMHIDSGSFLDSEKNHLYTVFLYNYLNVDAATIGYSELNLKKKNQGFFEYFNLITRKNKFNLTISNLFNLKNVKPVDLKNVKTSHMQTINGLKVGFVGIIPKSLLTKTSKSQINGVYIQNEAKHIIKKSNMLRRSGADIVLLGISSSIDCTSQKAHELEINESKVNFNPNDSTHCDSFNNELVNILNLLPKNAVDVVVTSGKKSKVANKIMGYPVMQNEGQGQYLSWIELFYDTKLHRVSKEMTRIHQPVKLCHNFIKSTLDCYTKEDLNNEEIMPATFLGHKVIIKSAPIY